MASGMAVMCHRQLRAAVGQIRHTNLFSGLLHDVIKTAPGDGREIVAIWIARPILDRAGDTHIFLRLRKPRRNFGVVDGPVFAKSIQAGGLEVDIAITAGRTSPEVCLASCSFAALPIPVRSHGIRVRNIVLPQMRTFVVLGFFHGIAFLVSKSMVNGRIAEAAVFQIKRLSMSPVIFFRIGARAGIEGQDIETRFAENLQRGAATRSRPNNNRVVHFGGGHWKVLRFLCNSGRNLLEDVQRYSMI